MNVAQRHTRHRLEEPAPVDGLMRYVMLGSTYASLFACMFLVRYLLEMPQRVEVVLPLKRVTQGEFTGADAPGPNHTITVDADGIISWRGTALGKSKDVDHLHLSMAILVRRVKEKDALPLVIRVSPQARHESLMTILNALAAVREKRYVLTFDDASAADLTWRGG